MHSLARWACNSLYGSTSRQQDVAGFVRIRPLGNPIPRRITRCSRQPTSFRFRVGSSTRPITQRHVVTTEAERIVDCVPNGLLDGLVRNVVQGRMPDRVLYS